MEICVSKILVVPAGRWHWNSAENRSWSLSFSVRLSVFHSTEKARRTRRKTKRHRNVLFSGYHWGECGFLMIWFFWGMKASLGTLFSAFRRRYPSKRRAPTTQRRFQVQILSLEDGYTSPYAWFSLVSQTSVGTVPYYGSLLLRAILTVSTV